MLPSPVDAVIFDMDGLLLDTEPLYRSAIFSACDALGFAMTDDLHLSLVGTPNEVGDAKLVAHFGKGFSLADYHRSWRAHFEQSCRERVPLRPGAAALLRFLAERGVPCAVATSTARPLAEDHLRRSGLFEQLQAVVTRSDVEHGKPHPESYLRAAALLGARPAHCLALEDSYNGVRAAAAAGMATVMVPDLLPANDAMRALCVAIAPNLEFVLRQLQTALARERST